MAQNETINSTSDYVNYTFNVEAKGIGAVGGELVGLSNTVSNLLGDIAFKTSELLSYTETVAVGASTMVGAMFVSATKDAIRFEQQMANVKAIGGESLNAQEIGSAAMEYSNKFGMATASMTEGLEALARAGITTTSVMQGVLEEGVKLSKLEGLDLEDSINDLISTTNLLATDDVNMNDIQYAEMVKQMNQHIVSTSESAPINAQNIIQSLQHVGGYASASGIDQDDLFAVIAQLGARGTKGEMAGTALRAFVAAGQKDTAQRALARIGLNVSDLWSETGETMLSISEMKDVLDEAMENKGYSKQEKLEFYSDFAGYKQANQIMKIDTSEVQQYKEQIANAWDLGHKLNTILGTVKGNLDRIWQITQNFMTKVGSKLLIVANAILTPVRMLLEFIDKIPFADTAFAVGMITVAFGGVLKVINNIVPRFTSFFTQISNARREVFDFRNIWRKIPDDIADAKKVLDAMSDPRKMLQIQQERQLYSKKQMSDIDNKVARLFYIESNWNDARISNFSDDEKNKYLTEVYQQQDPIFHEDYIKALKLNDPEAWDKAVKTYLTQTTSHAQNIASDASYDIPNIATSEPLWRIDKYVSWIWNILKEPKDNTVIIDDRDNNNRHSDGPKDNRQRNAEARARKFNDIGDSVLNKASQYGDYSYRVNPDIGAPQFKYDSLEDMRNLEEQVLEDIRKKKEMYIKFINDKSIEAGRNRLKKSLTIAAKTDLGYEFSTGANTSDIKHILETGNIRQDSSHITNEQLQDIADVLNTEVTGNTNNDMQRFYNILKNKNDKDALLDQILQKTQKRWNDTYYNNGRVGFFPTKALEQASHGETAQKIMQKVGVSSIREVQEHFKTVSLDDTLLNECVDIMYEDKELVDTLVSEEIQYMYENLVRVRNSIRRKQNESSGFHSKGETEYETNLQKARDYVLSDFDPRDFADFNTSPFNQQYDLMDAISFQNDDILYQQDIEHLEGFQGYIYPVGTDIAQSQRYGNDNFKIVNIKHVPYNDLLQKNVADIFLDREGSDERYDFMETFADWVYNEASLEGQYWHNSFDFNYSEIYHAETGSGFENGKERFDELKQEFEEIYRSYIDLCAYGAQSLIEATEIYGPTVSYRGGRFYTPVNSFGSFNGITSTALTRNTALNFYQKDPVNNKMLKIYNPDGINGVIAHSDILNDQNSHLWARERELTLAHTQPYLNIPDEGGYRHRIVLTLNDDQQQAVKEIMGEGFEFEKNSPMDPFASAGETSAPPKMLTRGLYGYKMQPLNKDTLTTGNMGEKLKDLLTNGTMLVNREYQGGALGEANLDGSIEINPGVIRYHSDKYKDKYGEYGESLLDTVIHEMTHVLMMHNERQDYQNNEIPSELGIDNFHTAQAIEGYKGNFVAEYEANYVSSEVLSRLGIEASQKSQQRMAAFKNLIEEKGYGDQIQYELLDSLVEEMLNNISTIGDITQTISTHVGIEANASNAQIAQDMRPVLTKIQAFKSQGQAGITDQNKKAMEQIWDNAADGTDLSTLAKIKKYQLADPLIQDNAHIFYGTWGDKRFNYHINEFLRREIGDFILRNEKSYISPEMEDVLTKYDIETISALSTILGQTLLRTQGLPFNTRLYRRGQLKTSDNGFGILTGVTSTAYDALDTSSYKSGYGGDLIEILAPARTQGMNLYDWEYTLAPNTPYIELGQYDDATRILLLPPKQQQKYGFYPEGLDDSFRVGIGAAIADKYGITEDIAYEMDGVDFEEYLSDSISKGIGYDGLYYYYNLDDESILASNYSYDLLEEIDEMFTNANNAILTNFNTIVHSRSTVNDILSSFISHNKQAFKSEGEITKHVSTPLTAITVLDLFDENPDLEEITMPPSAYSRTSKKYLNALEEMGVNVIQKHNWGAKSQTNGLEFDALDLLNQGLAPKEIAEQLDVPLHRAYYLLNKANAKYDNRKKKHNYDEVQALVEQGLSAQKISNELDIPLRSVYHIIKQNKSKQGGFKSAGENDLNSALQSIIKEYGVEQVQNAIKNIGSLNNIPNLEYKYISEVIHDSVKHFKDSGEKKLSRETLYDYIEKNYGQKTSIEAKEWLEQAIAKEHTDLIKKDGTLRLSKKALKAYSNYSDPTRIPGEPEIVHLPSGQTVELTTHSASADEIKRGGMKKYILKHTSEDIRDFVGILDLLDSDFSRTLDKDDIYAIHKAISEGEGSDWRKRKNLLQADEKLGDKIGVINVGTAADCINRGTDAVCKLCNECYAWIQMFKPNVARMQIDRSMFFREHTAEQISEYINKSPYEVFRVSQEGDFRTLEDYLKIAKIAELNPDKRFYGYTKVQEVLDYIYQNGTPKNLQINNSLDTWDREGKAKGNYIAANWDTVLDFLKKGYSLCQGACEDCKQCLHNIDKVTILRNGSEPIDVASVAHLNTAGQIAVFERLKQYAEANPQAGKKALEKEAEKIIANVSASSEMLRKGNSGFKSAGENSGSFASQGEDWRIRLPELGDYLPKGYSSDSWRRDTKFIKSLGFGSMDRNVEDFFYRLDELVLLEENARDEMGRKQLPNDHWGTRTVLNDGYGEVGSQTERINNYGIYYNRKKTRDVKEGGEPEEIVNLFNKDAVEYAVRNGIVSINQLQKWHKQLQNSEAVEKYGELPWGPNDIQEWKKEKDEADKKLKKRLEEREKQIEEQKRINQAAAAQNEIIIKTLEILSLMSAHIIENSNEENTEDTTYADFKEQENERIKKLEEIAKQTAESYKEFYLQQQKQLEEIQQKQLDNQNQKAVIEKNAKKNAEAYKEYYQDEADIIQERNEAIWDSYSLVKNLQNTIMGNNVAVTSDSDKEELDDDLINMLKTKYTKNVYEEMNDFDKARYHLKQDGKDHKFLNMGIDAAEWFTVNTTGLKDKFFNKVSNLGEQYPQEEAAQYTNAIGNMRDSLNKTLQPMRDVRDVLQQASTTFPPLAIAVSTLNTVISIGEGIVWALNLAESILNAEKTFDTFVTWGLITAEQAETLSKGVATVATWGLTTAIGVLETVMLPLVAVVLAVVAAIEILKFTEKRHAEALKESQKQLQEATAKSSIALSQYKSLKKARENETDAIKKQQAARKEAIALYKLEAARIERRNKVHEEAKLRNDAVWGEYGLRASLQKMGLGFIAGGDFESQAENYEGTTKNIREIKEATLGNLFATSAQREAAGFYDRNQMFFAEVEAYQKPLQELYDKESKLIEQYGDIDLARGSKEFEDAVQEFADATGINGETAVKMLDWLETENKVNQAVQVGQARIGMIMAERQAKIMEIEYGDQYDTDFSDVGNAMLMAQFQEMMNTARTEIWWDLLFAYLDAIITGLNPLNWVNGELSKKMAIIGVNQEALATINEQGNDIYNEMLESYENSERRDYGDGGVTYGDTPFGWATGANTSYQTQQQHLEASSYTNKPYVENAEKNIDTATTITDTVSKKDVSKRVDYGDKITNNKPTQQSSQSQGNTIIIKNININTEDDPEKIKTAFMNLMIELEEQITPRQVSRVIGESSANSISQDANADAQNTEQPDDTTQTNVNTNTNDTNPTI